MAAEKWTFDAVHSSINFSVRHLVISKVRGRFKEWTGTLDIDEANPSASRLEVVIAAASIDTDEPKRDEHLRNNDFLDVPNHPTITFRGTKVHKIDGSRLQLTGDLTIRGVTRPVTLDVEYSPTVKDPWGGERRAFTATTAINRMDFGVAFNPLMETGGFVVGDKIDIAVEVEVVKAAPVPA